MRTAHAKAQWYIKAMKGTRGGKKAIRAGVSCRCGDTMPGLPSHQTVFLLGKSENEAYKREPLRVEDESTPAGR